MKKLTTIFLTMFLLQASNTKAQITLDTIIVPQTGIGYSFFPVQISATETKYFFSDTLTNTFSLYNMDFTPFLTNISVPEPFGWIYQVMYLSRTLFDCDSTNIEYAFGATTAAYHPYRIMRTDGTQLFQLDSAYGPYCLGGCQGMSDYTRPIRNTSDGAKLFLWKHAAPWPYYIYSLCGELPTEILDFSNYDLSFVKIYPNPSSGSVTFQITQPDNINQYELVILDGNAKEVQRQKINPLSDKCTIDVKSFSNGTYFYSLCTKNKTYQSGKFVLAK